MPGEQTNGDERAATSPPTHEISVETYQRLKSSLERGNYTSFECPPGESGEVIDKLTGELAETHTIMRVTIPKEGKDFTSVLSDIDSLAPEAARAEIDENTGVTHNFAILLEKTSQVSEKPVLAIIENLQYVSQGRGRDDLIRVVRALYNGRANSGDLKNLTFLLVADQAPTDLLEDTLGTPYNIGTSISIRD